ncbi:MAG: MaoC family dehydratase [Lachnospiraceae bacterium]|nr:MaoC family dehydratase [Lachnospiraceae bacterium]
MISIGQKASFSKTISESDVYLFAGITGDLNPLHVNEAAARKMMFGKRIAHGMLTSSFISTVIASSLPGPGTIYMEQNSRFLAPVYLGDTITACVEVEELLPRGKARLRTQVFNQDGKLVVDGTALVKLPKEEQAAEDQS